MIRNYPQEFIDADTIFLRRLAEQETELADCERRLGIARERIRDLYAGYYRQMSTLTMHATSEAIERRRR